MLRMFEIPGEYIVFESFHTVTHNGLICVIAKILRKGIFPSKENKGKFYCLLDQPYLHDMYE